MRKLETSSNKTVFFFDNVGEIQQFTEDYYAKTPVGSNADRFIGRFRGDSYVRNYYDGDMESWFGTTDKSWAGKPIERYYKLNEAETEIEQFRRKNVKADVIDIDQVKRIEFTEKEVGVFSFDLASLGLIRVFEYYSPVTQSIVSPNLVVGEEVNGELKFYFVGQKFIPRHEVKYDVKKGGYYSPILDKVVDKTDLEIEERKKEESKGFGAGFKEIKQSIVSMPNRMKQLALVQFLTWPGLFLMWFFYTPTVAVDIFGGSPGSQAYTDGQNLAGLTYSFENIITFLFALALPLLARKFSMKWTHFICLILGGLGLIMINLIQSKDQVWMLFVIMGLVGIAWSSILSMPYAMLTGCLPQNKIGIYMGIFNFFIVLPEILASLFFGKIMEHWLDGSRMAAVTIGGVLIILAAFLTLRIKEN
jgi:hypothetical protein